jgi:hypothetical protein
MILRIFFKTAYGGRKHTVLYKKKEILLVGRDHTVSEVRASSPEFSVAENSCLSTKRISRSMPRTADLATRRPSDSKSN